MVFRNIHLTRTFTQVDLAWRNWTYLGQHSAEL